MDKHTETCRECSLTSGLLQQQRSRQSQVPTHVPHCAKVRQSQLGSCAIFLCCLGTDVGWSSPDAAGFMSPLIRFSLLNVVSDISLLVVVLLNVLTHGRVSPGRRNIAQNSMKFKTNKQTGCIVEMPCHLPWVFVPITIAVCCHMLYPEV